MLSLGLLKPTFIVPEKQAKALTCLLFQTIIQEPDYKC